MSFLNEDYLLDFDVLLEKKTNEHKFGFDVKDLKSNIKSKKVSGSDIKGKITKMIAHSPESLASDVPTVFDIIFYTIVIGVPTMITPLLTIPVIIATKVIRDSADAKVIGKYISSYNLQINRVDKKIKSETNENKKKFWEDYKSKLEDGRENLMRKREDLLNIDPEDDKSITKTGELLKDSVDILEKELSLLTEEQLYTILDENKLKDIKNDVKYKAKEVKQNIKKKENKMDTWFDDTLKSIRNSMRNEDRDKFIEGGFPKLSKMIRRAIIAGVSFAVSPALAAINIVTMYAINKRTKEQERKRILQELNRELEITEEKIKDADSNGDKEKKYQLMRIRQKLQSDIARIKGYI